MHCSITVSFKKFVNRYHQDLYYEDDDSDFETLGIPSDEETRHINEVPLEKESKKRSNSGTVAMTHKPKIPPKPKWTPAMDLSQVNNSDENLRKRTQVLKKEITASMPAVTSGEKPSLPKQLSLQPQKMVASLKDTNINTPDDSKAVTTCNEKSSLLNNSYQPSNLSNLKFGDGSSTPNTPDAAVKKNVELTSFATVTAEDKNASPETTKTNNGTPHSGNSTKEDGDVFGSLSIDSGEQDEVISDGEDEVVEENHDEMVDLPDGDEETAKGKLEMVTFNQMLGL